MYGCLFVVCSENSLQMEYFLVKIVARDYKMFNCSKNIMYCCNALRNGDDGAAKCTTSLFQLCVCVYGARFVDINILSSLRVRVFFFCCCYCWLLFSRFKQKESHRVDVF